MPELFLRAQKRQGDTLATLFEFTFDKPRFDNNFNADAWNDQDFTRLFSNGLTDFTRLVFIDPDQGSELIVFDAVPNDPGNRIQFVKETLLNPPSLVIDCALRCRIIDNTEIIRFHAKINPQPNVPSQLAITSLQFRNSIQLKSDELAGDDGADFASLLAKLSPDAQVRLRVFPASLGSSPVEKLLQTQFSDQIVVLERVDRGSHALLGFRRHVNPSINAPLPFRVVDGSILVMERPVDGAESAPVDESIIEFRIPGEAMRKSWNSQISGAYTSSLRLVRGAIPISCMPHWEDSPAWPDPCWTLTIHGADSAQGSVLTVRNLLPTAGDFPALATFPCFNDQTGAPLGLDVRILAQPVPGAPADPANPVEQWLNYALQKSVFDNQGPAPASQTLRLGALDLDFNGRNDASPQSGFTVRFDSAPGSAPQTGAGPFINFDLLFSLNDARPGGEDDLPEGAPPVLTHPLIIAPAQPTAGSFTLEFQETTVAGQNQSVKLSLRSTDSPQAKGRKLLVLDSEPFLVARVDIPKFLVSDDSTTVATWDNARLAGAGWEIATGPDQQTFQLYLPPQGVGETMEKGLKADGFQDVEEAQPADFRFSPTAALTLKTTSLTKNFTEPPWNLRRLLGFPGQETPGAPVVGINFELLYGLSGTISYPFLRLTEIAARLGGTASTTPLPALPGFTNAQNSALNDALVAWKTRQARYAMRLGVLEPWDTHQPATGLVLTDGINYQLRDSAKLKYPVPGNETNPLNASDGLAGGYAWPFESKNIYESLRSAPASSSAKLANPYFSALGGWGFQKASFNNDLTTIYSSTTMGRTHYVSVERIGRIGVFWNTAKHVIVFERTVQRTLQFRSEQDALAGRPVLRKVREYVEILQPERSYPEFGAAPTTCGFVLSTNYKSRVMNVDGAWGGDVNVTDATGTSRSGWQVPLWKPTANPVVYPEPHILIEVATDPASGSASTLVEIDEPEKLYFFTSTDPGVDTHTDSWPAVPFVDYADVPQPSAAAAFGGGAMQDMPADDPAFPEGFGRFTIAVKPGDRPANVVSQRSQKPVSAALRTVTMGRSAPAQKPPAQAAASAPQVLLAGLPDRINSTLEGLAIAIKANTVDAPSVKTAIGTIKGDLAKVRAAANTVNGGAICDQIRQQAMKSVTLAGAQVSDQILREVHSLQGQIATQMAGAGDDWSKIEKTLSDAINQTFQDLAAPLNTLVGTKAGLISDLNALPGTVVKPALDHLLDAISKDADPLTTAALQDVQTAHANALQVLSSLEAQAMTWSGNWLGNRANPVSVALYDASNTLDATFAGVETNLAAGVSQAKQTLAGKVTDIQNAVQAAVTTVAGGLQNVAGSPLDSLQKTLNGYQSQFQNWLANHGSAKPSDYLQKLGSVVDGIETSVQNNLDAILTQVANAAGNQAFAACNALLPASDIDKAVTFINGLLDRVNGVLDVPAQIGSVIDSVRDSLSNQITQFGNRVGSLLPPVTGFTVPATTLQLFRAFGDPPQVPSLDFNGVAGQARNAVSYLFDQAQNAVHITPSLAGVFGGNTVGDKVQSLGISLPTTQLLDQLIPPDLTNFDLSKILPSFAGLSLTNLFPGLKMPDLSNKGVVVTHGLDPQSRRPWLEVDVNFPLAQAATIFSFGPLALTLVEATFAAQVKIDSATNPPQQTVNGKLSGNWELAVGGMLICVIEDTSLTFDQGGHVRFNISPPNVKLQGVLTFIADALSTVGSSGSGFSVKLDPNGPSFESILDLALPDIQFGAFGISNLRLGSTFGLSMSGGFTISAGLQVARQTAPFAITIFILDGGGWVDVKAVYTPGTGTIAAHVSIGIVAGASLAISLGPISGGVYIYFGIVVEYQSSGGNGLDIGLMLLIRGNVNLLGIVDASITLMLEAEYSQGQLTGRGTLDISIKICWCFTLSVHASMEYHFAGGAASSEVEQNAAAPPPGPAPVAPPAAQPNAFVAAAAQPLAAPPPPAPVPPAPPPAPLPPPQTAQDSARRYISLLE